MSHRAKPAKERAEGESEESAQALRLLFAGSAVVLVGLQSFLVGWGINTAAAESFTVERPDRLLLFLKLVLLALVPVCALNAAIGAFLAEKIVRPLGEIRRALSEVSRGNLEPPFECHPDEALGDYKAECQRMLQTLRELIYRDRGYVDQANEKLTLCQGLLERERPSKEDRERAQSLLAEAKSLMSIVNDHFLKGRRGEA